MAAATALRASIAACAVDCPVPPLAIARSVPTQSSLLMAKVPPNVIVPAPVIGAGAATKVTPLTVPAAATLVTVPAPHPPPMVITAILGLSPTVNVPLVTSIISMPKRSVAKLIVLTSKVPAPPAPEYVLDICITYGLASDSAFHSLTVCISKSILLFRPSNE